MGDARLDALFAPRSIALVGASDRSRWSALVDQALKAHGFRGTVSYVNPGAATVHGAPAVAALPELTAPVDVAYVMVPPDQVAGVVADGAAAGTKRFVVLTSGFAEAGPDGAERQAALARLAAEHGTATLAHAEGGGVLYVHPSADPGRALRITEASIDRLGVCNRLNLLLVDRGADGFELTGAPETGINVGWTPGPRGPVTYQDLWLRQYRVVGDGTQRR